MAARSLRGARAVILVAGMAIPESARAAVLAKVTAQVAAMPNDDYAMVISEVTLL